MNKTVKIIIGVVVIVALVAGGIYFGGLVGDKGQGRLKKIGSDKEESAGPTDATYDPAAKFKNSELKIPKVIKDVPLDSSEDESGLLPASSATYFYSDSFNGAEKGSLMEALVPYYYANALQGKFNVSEIKLLWKAGVSLDYVNALQGKFSALEIKLLWEAKVLLDYANALQGKFSALEIKLLWEAGVSLDYANALQGKFNVSEIKLLWKAGVSLDYVNALQGKFSALEIKLLWKAGVSLDYVMKVLDKCGDMKAIKIRSAHQGGVAAEDIDCDK